jgi:pilus assembly protein CpaE
MSEPIKVLIVDDDNETRRNLSLVFGFDRDFIVVGSAASGQEALTLAATLHPDIALIDVQMPGMDGIETTERMSSSMPSIAVVMMSIEDDPGVFRKAMLAGARYFLPKPIDLGKEAPVLHRAHAANAERMSHFIVDHDEAEVRTPARASGAPSVGGQVVTVFSPRGGVGRTTIALNFSVAASHLTTDRVVLVDGHLQFGDIGLLLNIAPNQGSIADIMADMIEDPSPDALDQALARSVFNFKDQSNQLDVIVAPRDVESALGIDSESFEKIIRRLTDLYSLVVIDTSGFLDRITGTAFELSDFVFVVSQLDIANFKAVQSFLHVAPKVGVVKENAIRLILNESDLAASIRIPEFEKRTGRAFDVLIPSDHNIHYAGNEGTPFVNKYPGSVLDLEMTKLARQVLPERFMVDSGLADEVRQREVPTQKNGGRFGGRFGGGNNKKK